MRSMHHLGDEFKESVEDATKRELCAFKTEAKRWSQSDNRPSAPSASADSATRTSAPHSFRNLHMYLYIYMLLFVCDWTEVFFIVCKHRFNPEYFLFLWPVCRGLILWPAFRCHACLDLAWRRSVLLFLCRPVFFSNSEFVVGHLGSLTAANWVSFDFNVSYSSC